MNAELIAYQEISSDVNIANREAVECVLQRLASEGKIIPFEEVSNHDLESLFIHLCMINNFLAKVFSMDSKVFARKRLSRGINAYKTDGLVRYVCAESLIDNLTINEAKSEAKRLISKALHEVRRKRTDLHDMARYLAVIGVRNCLEGYHDRINDQEMRSIMMEIEHSLEVALRAYELSEIGKYSEELLKCASNRRSWDTSDWYGYNLSD